MTATKTKTSDSINALAARYIEIRNRDDRADKMRGLKRAITVYSQNTETSYSAVVSKIKKKLAGLDIKADDL